MRIIILQIKNGNHDWFNCEKTWTQKNVQMSDGAHCSKWLNFCHITFLTNHSNTDTVIYHYFKCLNLRTDFSWIEWDKNWVILRSVRWSRDYFAVFCIISIASLENWQAIDESHQWTPKKFIQNACLALVIHRVSMVEFISG